MTHYSENPGSCEIIRFKPTDLGYKYVDSYAIDMYEYWDEPDIYKAVALAWTNRYTWRKEGNPWLQNGWILVCTEPYHRYSYPIILTAESFREVIK